MNRKNYEIIVIAPLPSNAHRLAQQHDTVLVAGKGTRIIRSQRVKYPFSDADVAQQALQIWESLQSAQVKPRGRNMMLLSQSREGA